MANELEKQTEELKRQTKVANELSDQIKVMTTDLVASQTTIARTYEKGLSGVSNQLGQGFSNVSRELGQMTATFSYGLNHVSNGLNAMAHSLSFMSDAICKRLDALHNIANNPLLTQTQELYRRALINYNKGFFEEALEDVKQAIEKYKTDYMSWFLMGHIYTFGEGEFSNVKNIELAISAFTQAAKYNSPNVTSSRDACLLAAEIYFYWGSAQYLKYSSFLQNSNNEEASTMLSSALTSFEKSFQYSDKMFEALFSLARCKVKQNKLNEVMDDLEKLFLLDRNYCINVLNDTDFFVIKNEIESLIIKLRHNVFIEAEQKYLKVISLIEECKTLKITKFSEIIPSEFSEELPYFDVLDFNVEFEKIIPQIETTIIETKELNRQKEKERLERQLREQKEKEKDDERRRIKEEKDKKAREFLNRERNIWIFAWGLEILAIFMIILTILICPENPWIFGYVLLFTVTIIPFLGMVLELFLIPLHIIIRIIYLIIMIIVYMINIIDGHGCNNVQFFSISIGICSITSYILAWINKNDSMA